MRPDFLDKKIDRLSADAERRIQKQLDLIWQLAYGDDEDEQEQS
jgi:hypothetical protein